MGLRPVGLNPIATDNLVEPDCRSAPPGTAQRHIACDTLDMLKSGIRRAGMAVREK